MRRRIRWVVASTVIGLVTVWGSIPASAVPGTHEIVPIDATFVVHGACRFPVRVTEDGQLGIGVHVDADGEVVFIAETPNIDTTFTNTRTGESILTRDVGLDKVVFEPDGSAWILSTGLHVRFVLPGGGLVFGRIGLQIITLDADGGFVSLEIIGGRFDDRDFRAFVCDSLG